MVNETLTSSNGRLRTVGVYSGYTLFFILTLFVSLLLTFPSRQVKGFVEAQSRAAGFPLNIGELELSGIGGVRLTDVYLTVPMQPRKQASAAKPRPPMVLHVDELEVDVALLDALSRRLNASFSVALEDGVIEGGRVILQGRSVDLTIERIDQLDLDKLGVGPHALAFQRKLLGELEGLHSGSLQIHWGGSAEDFKGKIDLELSNAVLRSPKLDLQGGIALTDLKMGLLTFKTVIDKVANIAILKGQSIKDKATAISFEGVDLFGPDIELVAEERSHISIPPGKAGMRLARIQAHVAFALPQSKEETNADKAGAVESSRLKWSDLMKFAGAKLRPFERSGYIGLTCTGALMRPKCVPSLPQVTVGTRRKARSETKANNTKKKTEKKKPKPVAKKADSKAKEAAKKPAIPTKGGAKVELKTVQDRKPSKPGVGGDKKAPADKEPAKKEEVFEEVDPMSPTPPPAEDEGARSVPRAGEDEEEDDNDDRRGKTRRVDKAESDDDEGEEEDEEDEENEEGEEPQDADEDDKGTITRRKTGKRAGSPRD